MVTKLQQLHDEMAEIRTYIFMYDTITEELKKSIEKKGYNNLKQWKRLKDIEKNKKIDVKHDKQLIINELNKAENKIAEAEARLKYAWKRKHALIKKANKQRKYINEQMERLEDMGNDGKIVTYQMDYIIKQKNKLDRILHGIEQIEIRINNINNLNWK